MASSLAGETHELVVTLSDLQALADLIADDGSVVAVAARIAAEVARRHAAADGCTVGLDGHPVVTGYAVGRRDLTQVRRAITAADAIEFINAHLTFCRINGLVFGTWTDAGCQYLQAVRVHHDLADALRDGRAEGQRVIWDLGCNQPVHP
jgi:hypothetical protein